MSAWEALEPRVAEDALPGTPPSPPLPRVSLPHSEGHSPEVVQKWGGGGTGGGRSLRDVWSSLASGQ